MIFQRDHHVYLEVMGLLHRYHYYSRRFAVPVFVFLKKEIHRINDAIPKFYFLASSATLRLDFYILPNRSQHHFQFFHHE
ncbi:hypothetical protein GLOIN_2v1621024 [Rhizophagus irregularis DAOM 181602=DAOM 197198]|uniref:Uncharacterized protein n=1 Tax=Rhizophagus irregularis (strain DAOM 181602 / DAOM 197198 / MUCL 43194) TaxID=747089 RepID=A0A2P4PXJ8_RHIID|nr:hypothetical protein GLOIN_2v1621024 [Rhizophagus irregularis DAOM 181602=DAOM 197198]POG70085.1 hypothetical protein GLOIN_2v1621024 [Rhizophagus irregularis DAOM 181602=DAOM 197198]|eukprot:XP_025176951.1 hypothetical protein GLOIN_2v1621024 [Rhizophagus irregularis DAOM 181602=DAOM 197198]